MKKKKGIFCLEGLWENDLRKKSTVEPMLRLLSVREDIPYIHNTCATSNEFEFYAKRFTHQRYTKYPILYLAFHGDEGGICTSNKSYTLDNIGELLKDKCKKKIIILSSCGMLKGDKRHLKRFLNVTKALAVCGYCEDVDWMRSAALDLLLLNTLQNHHFDGRGLGSIEKRTNEIGKVFKDLQFRIVTRSNK